MLYPFKPNQIKNLLLIVLCALSTNCECGKKGSPSNNKKSSHQFELKAASVSPNTEQKIPFTIKVPTKEVQDYIVKSITLKDKNNKSCLLSDFGITTKQGDGIQKLTALKCKPKSTVGNGVYTLTMVVGKKNNSTTTETVSTKITVGTNTTNATPNQGKQNKQEFNNDKVKFQLTATTVNIGSKVTITPTLDGDDAGYKISEITIEDNNSKEQKEQFQDLGIGVGTTANQLLNKKINIQPKDNTATEQYTLSITITKGNNSTTATATITVAPKGAPCIELNIPTGDTTFVGCKTPIKITPSNIDGPVSYEVVAIDGKGNNNITLADHCTLLQNDDKTYSLVLYKFGKYKIEIAAKDEDGNKIATKTYDNIEVKKLHEAFKKEDQTIGKWKFNDELKCSVHEVKLKLTLVDDKYKELVEGVLIENVGIKGTNKKGTNKKGTNKKGVSAVLPFDYDKKDLQKKDIPKTLGDFLKENGQVGAIKYEVNVINENVLRIQCKYPNNNTVDLDLGKITVKT